MLWEQAALVYAFHNVPFCNICIDFFLFIYLFNIGILMSLAICPFL